jgi:hypothetical protein
MAHSFASTCARRKDKRNAMHNPGLTLGTGQAKRQSATKRGEIGEKPLFVQAAYHFADVRTNPNETQNPNTQASLSNVMVGITAQSITGANRGNCRYEPRAHMK